MAEFVGKKRGELGRVEEFSITVIRHWIPPCGGGRSPILLEYSLQRTGSDTLGDYEGDTVLHLALNVS